jgi:hypothetical protein
MRQMLLFASKIAVFGEKKKPHKHCFGGLCDFFPIIILELVLGLKWIRPWRRVPL